MQKELVMARVANEEMEGELVRYKLLYVHLSHYPPFKSPHNTFPDTLISCIGVKTQPALIVSPNEASYYESIRTLTRTMIYFLSRLVHLHLTPSVMTERFILYRRMLCTELPYSIVSIDAFIHLI